MFQNAMTLYSLSVLTNFTRSISLSLVSYLDDSYLELTQPIVTSFLAGLNISLNIQFPISNSDASSALTHCGLLLASPTLASSSSFVIINNLLEAKSLQSADALTVRSIIRSIARSLALSITNYAQPANVEVPQLKLQVNRNAFNFPTTSITSFSDSSLTVSAPNGVGVSGYDILDLYTIKYISNYFTSIVTPNGQNISSAVFGVELWDGKLGNPIPVANLPNPVSLTLLSSNITSTPVYCNYINLQTGLWANDGVNASSFAIGTSVTCTTTHFTEFASFNASATAPINPTNNNLYYLLFLLAIPVALIILIVIIIIIVAIVLYRRRSSRVLGKFTTELEDLGI